MFLSLWKSLWNSRGVRDNCFLTGIEISFQNKRKLAASFWLLLLPFPTSSSICIQPCELERWQKWQGSEGKRNLFAATTHRVFPHLLSKGKALQFLLEKGTDRYFFHSQSSPGINLLWPQGPPEIQMCGVAGGCGNVWFLYWLPWVCPLIPRMLLQAAAWLWQSRDYTSSSSQFRIPLSESLSSFFTVKVFYKPGDNGCLLSSVHGEEFLTW